MSHYHQSHEIITRPNITIWPHCQTPPRYLTSLHYRSVMWYHNVKYNLTLPLFVISSMSTIRLRIYCYDYLFLPWIWPGFQLESDFGRTWIWACRYLALSNQFVMLSLGNEYRLLIDVCTMLINVICPSASGRGVWCFLGWLSYENVISILCVTDKFVTMSSKDNF